MTPGERASGPNARTVSVNGERCRIWEQGSGEVLAYLPGISGLPRWTPFLESLSRHRRVVVLSMPGHPGSLGHDRLDHQLDWLVAMRELLEAAGAAGADLAGTSVGGALAADLAALWPESVPRLVLVGPLGLYDPREPVTDLWAQKPAATASLLCHDPARYLDLWAAPPEADPVEWQIQQVRANTADARMLWPMCDTGLAKRLHRITAPTLLVWGENDRVMSPGYADKFARGIGGTTTVVTVPEAGHLVDLDAPQALCSHLLDFLGAAGDARIQEPSTREDR